MTTIAHPGTTNIGPNAHRLANGVRPQAARAGAALATACRVAGHFVVAAATVAVLGADTEV